jgi:heat shock protein HslJ
MAIMNISRNPLILAVALPLFAACQTMSPPGEPATDDPVYTARGNEPGWILKMDSKTIDYQGDYGETKIRIPAPEGRPSFNGMRYVSERLTVDVTYSTCTDDMSGKRFADTVTVSAGDKQVKGCGGRALPPESLHDTTWTIVMIGQMPVLDDVRTEVRFADGRISGTAGCNRFNGDYSIASNVLTVGPVVSTRMMCPEKQMAQEAKFLALMASKLTKRYSVSGDLILADDKGNRATLRQVL